MVICVCSTQKNHSFLWDKRDHERYYDLWSPKQPNTITLFLTWMETYFVPYICNSMMYLYFCISCFKFLPFICVDLFNRNRIVYFYLKKIFFCCVPPVYKENIVWHHIGSHIDPYPDNIENDMSTTNLAFSPKSRW